MFEKYYYLTDASKNTEDASKIATAITFRLH